MRPVHARTVLARYLRALNVVDQDLWMNATQALARYETLYNAVMALKEPLDDQGRAVLKQFHLNNHDAWPVLEENPFGKWMKKCYRGKYTGYSLGSPHGVLEGRTPLSDYQADLKQVHDTVADVVSEIGPERFIYKGFKIYNKQRMTDGICMPMLEAIDYVVALFKKRSVSLELLRKGLHAVYLEPTAGNLMGTTEAAGTYLWGVIELSAAALRSTGGKLLNRWMNEVFLHEFGHHVHLEVLPPEAAQAWEEPWTAYDNAIDSVNKRFKQLSRQERERYFSLLERTHFDVSKAAAKLKGLEKLKFGVWLRNSRGKPLIKPNRFQLTEEGKSVFDFFKDFYRDPTEYVINDYRGVTLTPEQIEEKKQLLLEIHMRHLNLDDYQKSSVDISEEQVKLLADADPEMNRALIEANVNLSLLKETLVTDYAKTNAKEDFAETFVAFMDAPHRLSEASRFRMQRTLWLAGFYGKPITRLAGKQTALEAP